MTSSRTLGGVGIPRPGLATQLADTGGLEPRARDTGAELAGSTLAGRYDVLDLLGAGGMGAVYRAHDRELDEIVALKVIRGDVAKERGMVEQFRHEVKLARRVTHVNIARTFVLGVEGDLMFCTMELVEGESLRARLLREGALHIAEAASIATALCEGLAVAHAAGVIHRDIKPENVLLTSSGRVVLADFGVAAFSAADSDGALVGTLEYMAPEQARGEAATPATDIYALGVVLFEMLCGMRAFAGTMSEILIAKQDVEKLSIQFAESLAREPLPPELRELVERATAREPAQRIASAAELGRRLSPYLVVGQADTRTDIAGDDEIAAVSALPTVVVLAPRATSPDAPLHIAEGIHQETLRRLASRRLRVWPRVHAFDMPGATFIELTADKTLVVSLRRDHLASTLEVPLEIDNLSLAADAIAVAATELATRESSSDDNERLELLLRARARAHTGFSGIAPAVQLLQQGHARWPSDPRIACQLADLILRFVFVASSGAASFSNVRALVEAALAGAPELAESHVAAGQLALHTGDPEVAAREFRTAIACSPYQAEGHEGLGRLLLEAGFLDDATARLDNALAIAPKLSSVRWEIARAHALEGNWVVLDRLLAELLKDGDRPIARARFAVWRRDPVMLQASYEAWNTLGSPFEAETFQMIFDILLEGGWERHREAMIGVCMTSTSPSKRRLAFLAQVTAEISGYVGDHDICLTALERCIELDLFDRHWFDKCPTIAVARSTPKGQALQQRVRIRAESILDALYGDRSDRQSFADTTFAP